jgi:hypothetical protein
MSLSAGLGTVIGLVFIFALVSLFCSALTETLSNLMERRARYLLTGLRSMLDEEESKRTDKSQQTAGAPAADTLHGNVKQPEQTDEAADRVKASVAAPTAEPVRVGDLTMALFAHPLIRSLQMRRIQPGSDGKIRNPQYIPSKLFARALVDTLLPQTAPRGEASDRDVLRSLEEAVSGLNEGLPARRSLLALLGQASGDLRRFEESVENWYDAQMGRISGWYKRWSKVVLGVAGLLIAIIANIDTLQIAHGLYADEPVRQAVVAQATNTALCQNQADPIKQRQCVDAQIAALDSRGLPIWYPSGCDPRRWSTLDRCWNWEPGQQPDGWRFLLKMLGWGLTAFAVSFGAPFWFDALSKVGSLRSTGPKPAT